LDQRDVIEVLLEQVLTWAASRSDVRAVGLLGSHARGTARADLDVDLIPLVERPGTWRATRCGFGASGQ
jgi:predicted nucleotidyltransferase